MGHTCISTGVLDSCGVLGRTPKRMVVQGARFVVGHLCTSTGVWDARGMLIDGHLSSGVKQETLPETA